MSSGGGGSSGPSSEEKALFRAQADISREMWSLYKQEGLPLMQDITDDAMGSLSGADYAKAAGLASADVSQAYANMAEQQKRDASRYGINPASGRFQGMQRGLNLDRAATMAGAQTKARNDLEMIDYNKKMQAANLWAGNPGTALGGYGAAAGGLSSANASARAADAQETAGVMGAIGTGVGAFLALSSKDYKEGKAGINEDEVLARVRGLPVESWQYKQGIEDGGAQRHIGPYAEDFNKAFGLPQRPAIDMVDAVGVNMAATKALANKVDRLEGQQKRTRTQKRAGGKK